MLIQKVGTSPSGAPKAAQYQVARRGVWASIEPLRGMASDENGVERQRALYAIRIRFMPVTKDMRFREVLPGTDPVDYQIETTMPDPLRRWIDLTCVRMEKAADLG